MYLSFLVIIEAQTACNAFLVEIYLENVFKQWQRLKLASAVEDVGSLYGTISHFGGIFGSAPSELKTALESTQY